MRRWEFVSIPSSLISAFGFSLYNTMMRVTYERRIR